ncbi:MAG: hypothetical protein QJQ54_02260 [Mollicutes bacterium]|nr:MAG: hypothetical protein QJQ54_02260 [Mollicutes bacterium]
MDFDYRIDFQSQLENLDLILLFKFDNLITELTKDFDKQEFHNG